MVAIMGQTRPIFKLLNTTFVFKEQKLIYKINERVDYEGTVV